MRRRRRDVLSARLPVSGTVRIRCPACKREQAVALVQSINAREHPELKARLLAGDLNVLACQCGQRTPLSATLLYHDPDRDYYCQACPGGEPAMREGEAAFAVIGPVGTRRLVPSQNALVEKVKILDAGLDDRVVEVLKVLLLAPTNDLDAILLFDRVDAGLVHWILLDDEQLLSSPLAGYEKLAATLDAPDDLRVDRAWAVEAGRAMMTNAN